MNKKLYEKLNQLDRIEYHIRLNAYVILSVLCILVGVMFLSINILVQQVAIKIVSVLGGLLFLLFGWHILDRGIKHIDKEYLNKLDIKPKEVKKCR